MENFPVFTISSASLSQNPATPELISRAKSGEESAFTEIYNLYFGKIYKFIYFRVGHKEVAEDLSEDVFVKVFSKIASVASHGSFEAWLYQIARNAVIDYYRAKKPATVALEEVENTLEYETNVIDALNLNQDQKILLELLKGLSKEQQIVLKLKFFEQLENSEIAELLHKNEGAIRVIQHRAIQKLQQLVKEHITK